nr:Crp/Fnr family transcriptional regulator [Acetobacter sacchari]
MSASNPDPLAKVAIRAVGDWPTDRVNEDGDIILSARDRALLRSLGTVSRFPKNATVYEEGMSGTTRWLLLDGIIRISHVDETGKRTILAFHWHGDIFGLCENGCYVNGASAVTDIVVVGFDRDAMRNTLLQTPQLQNDILVKATADLRLGERHMLLLTERPATRKFASFLLELIRIPECYERNTRILTLSMSREDIAAYLDMKIETVSRAITELAERKLIIRLSMREFRLSLASLKQFSAA